MLQRTTNTLFVTNIYILIYSNCEVWHGSPGPLRLHPVQVLHFSYLNHHCRSSQDQLPLHSRRAPEPQAALLHELLEVSYDHHLLRLLSHWRSGLLVVKEKCHLQSSQKTVKQSCRQRILQPTDQMHVRLIDVISNQFRSITGVQV
jgi:hypothetical protein|uniref:Uncharacterized protein n=1 Tax=Zea mays TaxID=4577 RepID=C0HJ80_MAIZE|nr:unknown [Zea mays]ACR35401.1 unknown [Zea mays]